VHPGFGQDQAAADLVMRGARLLEQLLGSCVVLTGALIMTSGRRVSMTCQNRGT
jgi:hypothetical protein